MVRIPGGSGPDSPLEVMSAHPGRVHGGRKCGPPAAPQWGDRWVVDALAMAKVDRAEETAMVTEYQRGSPFPGVVGQNWPG
jgi:hypothetical protein